MVFNAVMEGLVAKGNEEMIVFVMGSGEKSSGLRYQMLVLGDFLIR